MSDLRVVCEDDPCEGPLGCAAEAHREPTVEELAEALIERKGPPSDWLMPVIRKWFPDASGPDRVMMVLAFDEAIRGVVSDE